MFKFLSKIILYFVATLILIVVVAVFLRGRKKAQLSADDSTVTFERTDPLEKDTTIYTFNKHTRRWYDNEHNYHRIDFLARRDLAQSARFYRKDSVQNEDFPNLAHIDPSGFYFWLYDHLHQHDKNSLPHLISSIDSLNNSHQWNRVQFANAIVSMIQDIPYSYVVSGSCGNKESECDCECEDHEEYGILSPAEFAFTLHGDCDTRTLLLYLVLSHYNYDVAILISENYAHSMLGINLPVHGKSLLHNGKKYYFWETTARNWQVGELPLDYRITSYWRVALNT